jgi:hypothetical protein
MTPSARSTKYLRDRGWIVCRVEQTLHMPGRPWGNKKDAFGFGDLLAAHPEVSLIALVQVTSGSNHGARKAKIIDEPLAATWKESSGTILLHSWAKRGPRGKRKRWTLKEEVL